MEKGVVEGFATLACCGDEHPQIVDNLILTCEGVEIHRAQRLFYIFVGIV